MNLLHLQYFYTVAKEQGFTKASKVLRIQQPAISRMVKLLEEDVGFPLFEKIGRNVHLTPEGEELFAHCKEVFEAVDNLKQSLGKISGVARGALLIGGAEAVVSHFFPQILERYLAQFPEVLPQMYSAPAATLFDKIIKGELELGVFLHTPEVPDKLELFEVKDVRHRLVIRKDLRKNDKVLRQFIGSREIEDVTTKRFPTLEKLKKAHPGARITISSNNLTSHREMVLQGLGVSILPEILVAGDIKTGTLVDVFPEEKFVFQMKFIKRRTGVLSLAAAQFVRSCLEEGVKIKKS